VSLYRRLATPVTNSETSVCERLAPTAAGSSTLALARAFSSDCQQQITV